MTSPTAINSEARVGQAGNRGFELIYFMDGNNCSPVNTVNTIAAG